MLMPPVEDGGWVPKWVRWGGGGNARCSLKGKNHARGTRDERGGAFEQSEKVEKCAWWARTSSAVEERRAGLLRARHLLPVHAHGVLGGGSTGGEGSEAMRGGGAGCKKIVSLAAGKRRRGRMAKRETGAEPLPEGCSSCSATEAWP